MSIIDLFNSVTTPVPAEFPILAMILGLAVLLFGGLLSVWRSNPSLSNRTTFDTVFGLFTLTGGYLFFALAFLQSSYGAYAGYLYLLFRIVEGAAGVRFYHKVMTVIQTRHLPGGSSGFTTYLAATFFVTIGAVGLFIHIVREGAVYRSIQFDARMVYTAATFSISGLGIYWRMTSVGRSFNRPVIVGFVLCVAGAELFNYAFIGTELALYALGFVAYSIGFWSLAGCWALGLVSPNTSSP